MSNNTMDWPCMTPPFQESASLDDFTARHSVQIRDAFHGLLRALDYASVLNTSIWDFAVELSWFRRLKLSNTDLRWLVRAGFVTYAVEIPSLSGTERSFRHPVELRFEKDTCFVLTEKGAATARSICECGLNGGPAGLSSGRERPLSLDAPGKPLVPKWDRLRQELKIGTVLVKRFKVPAASQEAILEAFEEEAWPPRIDDPLSPRNDQLPKRRLQETIRSLNRNQKRPLIHFLGDGSGQGVLWQYCDEHEVLAGHCEDGP